MAGRGGRGAALLQALEAPPRRPGPLSAGDSTSIASKPPSMGRGSYLLSLAQQLTLNDTPPSAVTVTQDGGFREPMPTGSKQNTSHVTQTLQNQGQKVLTNTSVYAQLPIQQQVAQSQPQPHLPPDRSSSSSAPPLQQQAPATIGRGAALLAMCGPSPPRPVREVRPVQAERTLEIAEPVPKEKGKSGRLQPVVANYIKLKFRDQHWYQYSVTFTPNVDSRGLRYKLLYSHVNVIGEARVFDGSILFLPIELQNKVTSLFSQQPITGEQVMVKISFVTSVSLASRQCITMYNVLFKRIMNMLEMVEIGRGRSFDARSSISIPQHKLEVWPGYVTSVDHYEGGLLLMCDVSHKVLRHETAYDVMSRIYQDGSIVDKRSAVLKALVGASVITRYNNKTYRIDDIDFDLTPNSTFERKDGQVSFVEYYRAHYGIEIKDPSQMMLISRPKKRDQLTGEKREEHLALIPELSYMTGLTDDMRTNFKLMKDIALHTRVTPQHRQASLRKFLQNVNSNANAAKLLRSWGLELDMDSLQVDARVFKPESIFFYQAKEVSAGPNADWTRDVANNRVCMGVNLMNWVLVFSTRDQNNAVSYVNTYKKVALQMGVDVVDPMLVKLTDDRTDSYIKAIRERINQQVQLIVVIFPTKREDKYSAVKKLLVAERPCPSQIIISKTISDERKLRSVVQKITLQINAKLGGELWHLTIPLRNTMFVGIDVYHAGAKGTSQSVGGLVASLNATATRYYSRVTMQGPGEELIAGLKICLLAALKKYHSVNNKLPDKIVVFRDGVGDSMLEVVADHEVKQLSDCFKSFDDYKPGLAVIVVQKRINTRLFAVNRGNMENAPPGTVLDHTVTKNKRYDFFLVSQHVTQGTVSPTHYVVVHDSTSLTPDNMQQLAYKMCHLYYNWSGTVRVPAPCQYAHKLAYLIGESVRRDPSEHLADKLYYL